MALKIHLAAPTARARYALQLLFEVVQQIPYQLHPQPAGADVVYSASAPDTEAIWLPASGLLSEEGIRPQATDVTQWEGLPAFFPCPQANPAACLPYDLPAMVFYMASRYEEYLPFRGDQHGRFTAGESLAYRAGFLRRPLVHEWGIWLAERLRARFPGLQVQHPAYCFRPSYDIDMAWAYRHRPGWLQLAGAARDLLNNQPAFRQRQRVLRGQEADPFDTFAYLEQQHERYSLKPLWFFLLGRYGPYDKNADPRKPALRGLLRGLAQRYDTGLHPSYRANADAAQWKREQQHYRSITGALPVRSRQHFLRLHLPATYQQLAAQGIREDYTMGFADQPGFRAGLAVPFPWYDLQQEAVQPLTVFPFPFMDGTLRQYMQLSPEEAMGVMQELIAATKAVGGQLIPVWHNSSFSVQHGWGGWQKVHEFLLQQAGS